MRSFSEDKCLKRYQIMSSVYGFSGGKSANRHKAYCTTLVEHKRHPKSKILLTIVTLLFLFLAFSNPAYCAVYHVQASEKNYHYGCAGNIYVNTSVWVDLQKVTAIWTTRTDETAWCKIGHYWYPSSSPKAFYAYRSNSVPYTEKTAGTVGSGTYISYKVYYDGNYNVHRFYVGSSLVNSVSLPEMTSCWSATNAERWFRNLYYDNLTCFKDLKYKSSSTGSTWYNWSGVKTWYDNDPLFSNKFTSANRVDTIRDVN